MITLSLLSALSEKFSALDINLFIVNFIIAAILIGVGIFLGKFVKFLLRKIIVQARMGRTAQKSFVELFLTIIKWSIYILFISLALDQLGIPEVTRWLTSILVVIPALVGALILLGIGFAIAIYLRDLIGDSGIIDSGILSVIFFYFVLYVFMIFALKTALISQDKATVNIIILILTAIVSGATAYWYVKKIK